MSKIYLKSTFTHRCDTAENWSQVNPVLKKGEVGVELGSPSAMKIGDGVTPWNTLEYFAEKWADVSESDTSDGKKRTTLTGEAGHYLTLKSQESINIEGRGIALRPSNGTLNLNSGNGNGKVKIQNVADPTVATEAATKNYVDTAIGELSGDKQDKFADYTSVEEYDCNVLKLTNTSAEFQLRNNQNQRLMSAYSSNAVGKGNTFTVGIDYTGLKMYDDSPNIILMEKGAIKNVADPTEEQDAATKNYVDSKELAAEASLITNSGETQQLSLIARNQNGHVTAVSNTSNNTFDFANVQSARIELTVPETVNNTDCYCGQVYYEEAAGEPHLMGIFETRENNVYTAPLKLLPTSSLTKIFVSFTLMS